MDLKSLRESGLTMGFLSIGRNELVAAVISGQIMEKQTLVNVEGIRFRRQDIILIPAII